MKSLIGDIWQFIRADCAYSVQSVAGAFHRDPGIVREMLNAGVKAGVLEEGREGYRKVPKTRRRAGTGKQLDWVDRSERRR